MSVAVAVVLALLVLSVLCMAVYLMDLRTVARQHNQWFQQYIKAQDADARRNISVIQEWLDDGRKRDVSAEQKKAFDLLYETIAMTGIDKVDRHMYSDFVLIFDDARRSERGVSSIRAKLIEAGFKVIPQAECN